MSDNYVSQPTKAKWPSIVTLNAAHLFQWIIIIFRHNPRALWRICPTAARVTINSPRGRNRTLALAVTKKHLHFLIVESVTSPLLLQQPTQIICCTIAWDKRYRLPKRKLSVWKERCKIGSRTYLASQVNFSFFVLVS